MIPHVYVGHTFTENGVSLELDLYNLRVVYYPIFYCVVGDMVTTFFKLCDQEDILNTIAV